MCWQSLVVICTKSFVCVPNTGYYSIIYRANVNKGAGLLCFECEIRIINTNETFLLFVACTSIDLMKV